jgi:diguanylate cyclase (GGDEF)-like protein
VTPPTEAHTTDQQHEDDGAAQAPDTLRLVRLRLTLTLITVAILPVAIVAPVLRAVTDDSLEAQQSRLQETASRAAAELAIDLEGLRGSLIQVAGDPSLRQLVIEPTKTARTDAGASLLRLVERSQGLVSAVSVVHRDGTETLRLAGGSVVPPGDNGPAMPVALLRAGLRAELGEVVRSPVAGPASDPTFWLIAPLAPRGKDDGPAGVVRVELSLAAFVLADTADTAAPGRTFRLIDGASGTDLFSVGQPADASALPGRVIGLAADLDTADGGTATAELELPGFGDWSVAVSEPALAGSLPLEPIVALAALITFITSLTVLLARRILRPAAELEASRARLSELYEAARAAALRDHLTGLGNHRSFQEEFGRLLDQSVRYQVPAALLLFDIDEFKAVNDSLGHAVGDDLLAEVGRILRQSIRHADLAFRTGGDEFAVLMPHTNAAGAETLARRLLTTSLAERPGSRYPRPISFSAGVTASPEHGTGRLQLYAQADAALYWSKRHGRTLVSVYDPARDRSSLDAGMRAELSAAVEKVVAGRLLRPVYQPIVHLPTGRVLGYEGLVRPAPESGFPDPGSLFGAAETSGRVVELDLACLEVVTAGAAAIADPLLVSLNISPRSFESPDFSAGRLLAILRRQGIDPSRVLLELTEREELEDLERLQTALEACQKAGIRIAADDVGAGNAGLKLLSQIRFDVVKVDLSLIQGPVGYEPKVGVLSSLVSLAKRWGALVVAEGVETPEQLRTVRELSIEAAQGYLLGRPGPRTDIERVDVEALAGQPPEVGFAAVLAERAGSAQPGLRRVAGEDVA